MLSKIYIPPKMMEKWILFTYTPSIFPSHVTFLFALSYHDIWIVFVSFILMDRTAIHVPSYISKIDPLHHDGRLYNVDFSYVAVSILQENTSYHTLRQIPLHKLTNWYHSCENVVKLKQMCKEFASTPTAFRFPLSLRIQLKFTPLLRFLELVIFKLITIF